MNIMDEHAVYRLRRWRLAQCTRPYLARGGSVVRCDLCRLREAWCICAMRPHHKVEPGFCLLMYDAEPLKPSNTGYLISEVLPESTYAFQWSRTAPQPELLRLLDDPRWQPYVVFPASYAEPQRVVTALSNSPHAARRPLFIMLDGTWSEAKKMFKKSPYLAHLPVLSIDAPDRSSYQLRQAATIQQLCTAEVAIRLLEMSDETTAAQGLSLWFEQFRDRYLAGKYQTAARRDLASTVPSA